MGVGAVYSDSVPLEFRESVTFDSNTNTALASVHTGIINYTSQRIVLQILPTTVVVKEELLLS